MLLPYYEGDAILADRMVALQEGLGEAGWIEGENLEIEWRLAGNDTSLAARLATELDSLDLDAAFSASTPVTRALIQNTSDIPIVFAGISDPIGAGFVESLPRPGGRVTGFMAYEASLGGKWFQLLLMIAPHATRVGVLFNPSTVVNPGAYWFPSMEAAAAARGVEIVLLQYTTEGEIPALIQDLLSEPNVALLVGPDLSNQTFRRTIIDLVNASTLPTLYTEAFYVRDGGLVSYGASFLDMWRRAAVYLGLILDGARPAELPVQPPSKFDFAINLGTARKQGLDLPVEFTLLADLVVE
ncbi:MAG: ABC transporter substrate-binding protein [Bauldia sp.]|nr:ABC transporter substrate-binding protein [Bauldia sp.]